MSIKKCISWIFAISIVLVGLGQWPYIFYSTLPPYILIWRELLLFLLPGFFILYNCRMPSRWVFGILVASLGLSFVIAFSYVYGTSSYLQIISAALIYFSVSVFFFFGALGPVSLFIGIYHGLRWLVLIGGLGLFLDLMSGYAVSSMLHAGVRIDSQISEVPRAFFLFGSVTYAATLLPLSIIFLEVLKPFISRISSYKPNILDASLPIAASLGVLSTFSRVGFLLMGIYFVGLLTEFKKKSFRTAAVFSIGVIGISTVLNEQILSFLGKRVSVLPSSVAQMSEDYRVSRWLEGLHAIPDDFALGTGIGSGSTRAGNYGPINHYESTPLAVLNETGFIGFILFTFPIFILFKNQKSAKLILGSGRWPSVFVFALVCGISVNPGGGDYLIILMYSALAGLLVKYKTIPSIPRESEISQPT